jgi:hypothetical protein
MLTMEHGPFAIITDAAQSPGPAESLALRTGANYVMCPLHEHAERPEGMANRDHPTWISRTGLWRSDRSLSLG